MQLRQRIRGWMIALVVVSSTLCAPASAQDVRDEARTLARDGIAALEEGDADKALDLLKQAEAKFHAPTHLLYIGRALVASGQLVEAHRTFVGILVEEVPNYAPQAFHEAKKTAAVDAQALLPKIASLRIQVEGAPAAKVEVSVDGEPLPAARLAHPVAVPPGAHQVEASASGFSTAAQSVDTAIGGPSPVTLTLEPSAAADEGDAGEGDAGEAGDPLAGDEGSGTLTIVGGVALGVGAAALVVGAVTGGMTLSRAGDIKESCNGNDCPLEQREPADEAKLLGNVSTAMFAVGGALAAAGLIMVVVDVAGSGSGQAVEALQLRVGPAGMALSGRF